MSTSYHHGITAATDSHHRAYSIKFIVNHSGERNDLTKTISPIEVANQTDGVQVSG